MTDRDRQSLQDMSNSANLIADYLDDKTEGDFEDDQMLQDAIARRIEIVGEAATRLSQEAHEAIASVPWTQIVRMGNIMIHQNDRVDLQLVWNTATVALPQLARSLEPYV